MRLRNTVLCTLTLVLPLLTLSAQMAVPAAVIMEATATVTNLDPATGTYTVAIANNSAKDVTAFAFGYTEIYSDKRTIKGRWERDWGPMKWANHETLQPANIYVQTFHVDGYYKRVPVVQVRVDLLLVAYADLTVDVESGAAGEEAFQSLRAARIAETRSFEKSAEEVGAALAAPDDDPTDAALQRLTSLRSSLQRSHSRREVSLGLLDGTIRRLQKLPRGPTERQHLEELQRDVQAKAALYGKYAHVRRLP